MGLLNKKTVYTLISLLALVITVVGFSGIALGQEQIIPLSKIKPFFHHSEILTADQGAQNWPSIQALKGEHIVIGKGDSAYANQMTYPVGTVLTVFRLGKKLIHPKTNQYLGTEAEVIGKGVLTEVNADQVGTLKILASYREMGPGDLLMPASQEKFPSHFTSNKKAKKNLPEGDIIDVDGGVSQIGQYQIVTMTGGKDCGRKPGELFSVFHQIDHTKESNTNDTSMILPKVKTGDLLVFRVFDKLSYGLVVKATQPIYLLDTVTSP